MSARKKVSLAFLKWLPKKQQLKGGLLHRLIGDRLFDPKIWKMSAKSTAAGLGLGTFIALTPTFPLQMVLAAALSIFFRVNMPAALMACWITNPLTMPIFYLVEYQFGNWVNSVFSLPQISEFQQVTQETKNVMEIIDVAKKPHFFNNLKIFKDLIVGSLIISTVVSLLVYGLFYFLFTHVKFPRKQKEAE
ncbi:DUF2062 domain-containing protein [Fibrobacterota bacterium]